ncbi:MAG: CDP-alcohol phosphatidyltransferase family protein [Bacteroidales bacterium]
MPDDSERIWTPANVVTLTRILLIPVFVAALLSPWPTWFPEPQFWIDWQPWIAAAVFVIISTTDAIDGYLARSRNEVTDLGKFLDACRQVLCGAALLALVELRPFIDGSLVIIAAVHRIRGCAWSPPPQGKVIAASIFGKVQAVLRSAPSSSSPS